MTCLQDNVSLPFTTTVLDSAVEVIGFEDGACGGLVAICRRGRSRQRIPLADLPLPTPAVADHAWIHAYGPHCVRAYPSGFVVVRLNLPADSGVGGSAAPKRIRPSPLGARPHRVRWGRELRAL